MARIGEIQRGVVGRRQAMAAGITSSGIKYRLRARRWHLLYPGVYLIGRPRLEPLAAATAGVIYLDGAGVLSHRSAGLLWGILDDAGISGRPGERAVELTVVSSGARSRRGLVVHRSRTLAKKDVRRCRGLPVTSPARTLLDLAGVLREDELEAAYAIAARKGLVHPHELAAVMARAPHSRGVSSLRALHAAQAGADRGGAGGGRGGAGGGRGGAGGGAGTLRLTRSVYERRLLELIRRAELPTPQANAQVEGMEVDLLWPEQRLVVEFDGFAYHSDRAAFERDRLRDQRLAAAGFRVIRITARQLDTTPEAIVARIATALARGG